MLPWRTAQTLHINPQLRGTSKQVWEGVRGLCRTSSWWELAPVPRQLSSVAINKEGQKKPGSHLVVLWGVAGAVIPAIMFFRIFYPDSPFSTFQALGSKEWLSFGVDQHSRHLEINDREALGRAGGYFEEERHRHQMPQSSLTSQLPTPQSQCLVSASPESYCTCLSFSRALNARTLASKKKALALEALVWQPQFWTRCSEALILITRDPWYLGHGLMVGFWPDVLTSYWRPRSTGHEECKQTTELGLLGTCHADSAYQAHFEESLSFLLWSCSEADTQAEGESLLPRPTQKRLEV